ncbi:unnamed protein product [Symbiodinium natans]|uniref:Uncharacterized protein n=1 Tax=Symbiodinium natans TaxID=878477 RepID=A0A812GU06_9DINO|nr:unnamed protein product [Symbiodinium natans]
MDLSKPGGSTSQVWKSDGTLQTGPGLDHWHASGTCTGITAGYNFLQIGDWRLARINDRHFTFSHRGGQTPMMYKSDGTHKKGPRTSFGSWGWEAGKTPSFGEVRFGDHFIQFGEFRLGAVDDNHLSVSHSGGLTAMIFGQGTLHPGPRHDYGLWEKPLGEPMGVTFGDRFVQIGNFRLGDVDSKHFSVSHVIGKTNVVFKSDGTVNDWPGTSFTTFGRPLEECFVAPP